jgi:hypothetical protein
MSDLFAGDAQPDSGPVECLDQAFPSEQARRDHISTLLAEKMKDHDFRKIGSFRSARTKPSSQCRTRALSPHARNAPAGVGFTEIRGALIMDIDVAVHLAWSGTRASLIH